jgi:hypothetical protein
MPSAANRCPIWWHWQWPQKRNTRHNPFSVVLRSPGARDAGRRLRRPVSLEAWLNLRSAAAAAPWVGVFWGWPRLRFCRGIPRTATALGGAHRTVFGPACVKIVRFPFLAYTRDEDWVKCVAKLREADWVDDNQQRGIPAGMHSGIRPAVCLTNSHHGCARGNGLGRSE